MTEEILRKLNGLPSNAAARLIRQVQDDVRAEAIRILERMHREVSNGPTEDKNFEFDDGWTQACEIAMDKLRKLSNREPNDPVRVLQEQSAEGMPGPSVGISMPDRGKKSQ